MTRVSKTVVALLLAAGLPPVMVAGVSRVMGPRLGPDVEASIAAQVAADARSASDAPMAGRLGRLVFPVRVVTRVWRDDGHCGERGSLGEASRDASREAYRAVVRPLSWFAIPGPVVSVTCGGAGWTVGRGPASVWTERAEAAG